MVKIKIKGQTNYWQYCVLLDKVSTYANTVWNIQYTTKKCFVVTATGGHLRYYHANI